MTVRLPAPERRRQLLGVAIEEFGNRGYHDTSMNRLADAAGVTKPVLYQHFASKRELYLELLRDIGGRLRDAIANATLRAATPHAQVEAGFGAYFRFFADDHHAFVVLFGDGARKDEEFAAVSHAVEASIAESIAELIAIDGLDDDDRRLLAFGIVGLAEGSARYWVGRGLDIDPGRLATRMADLAWYGLRGRGSRIS
ncbi:MAG TPA: TetR/AcrR family transcriptional regulator [Acidimicrobiales bacterium]|jgi:AcrR family transcriptional regulator|nr:TetR/AcrR family transcriptional regulator [Acidimicrobiales bacterium]